MIDWMLEVMKIYNQSDSTCLHAVNLLDLYFKRQKTPVLVAELHLLGAIAMLLASKLSEQRNITILQVAHKICKGRFTLSEVRHAERAFLMAIGFDMAGPGALAYASLLAGCSGLPYGVTDPVIRDATLLLKMFSFSYDIMAVYSLDQLAVYALVIGLKLFENSHPQFVSDKHVWRVFRLARLRDGEDVELRKETVIQNLNFLRNFASQFKVNFPFSSLLAFH